MTRKRLGYLVMAVGLVGALVTGVLVYQQVVAAEVLKAALPTAQVVVATEDIDGRSQIKASQVGFRTVQNDLVYAGAATRLEDVVGMFNPGPILKGEIIGTHKIGQQGTNNAPSIQIEKGKEMYVMPISFGGAPFSVAQINALRPGDRVDLLYTSMESSSAPPGDQRPDGSANPAPYLQTRVMLQDLRIHSLGSFADDGTLLQATADPSSKTGAPSVDKTNIIFVVTPEQALVLKWLRDLSAIDKSTNVEMVLRSPTDSGQTDPNLVIDLKYMRQNFNFQRPDPAPSAASGR